ncbi:MAG: MotA/TolQ/ExbB proton channel family protein [Coriobacteriales bacterium]|jgi:biopolymer transport protein ExbB/TolQ
MELLQSLYLTQTMHAISEAMTVPVVVILLLLILYAIYTIGELCVEAIIERRSYHAQTPELVARLEECEPSQLVETIDSSGLLRNQKDDLIEMCSYLYLPSDGRTEVAKRLLANERASYQKSIDKNDAAAKVGPMIGLMGTLVPLGPGLVALGSGDTQTLSSSLQFAFDTTVAGLIVAVVCFLATKLRRHWYTDYLVSMEACFNALLEKGDYMHAKGYTFEHTVWTYDERGRSAYRTELDDTSEEGRAEEAREPHEFKVVVPRKSQEERDAEVKKRKRELKQRKRAERSEKKQRKHAGKGAAKEGGAKHLAGHAEPAGESAEHEGEETGSWR